LFRIYAGLVFSFAWVPVMYTAFTVDRGFDSAQYMRLWSVYYLAMVTAELPWGWLADRLGPRPLLVCGPLLMACGFAMLGHSESFEVCLLAMGVTGTAHAMISGADSAFLYEVVLSENRRDAALHEEAVAHRWRLFGVSAADLAGGFAAFFFGTAMAFDLSVALMIAATAVALKLPSVHKPSKARNRPRWTSVLRQLLRPPVLWVVGWYTTVFVFLRLGFQLYQPTLLAEGVHDLRWHGATLCLLNLVAGISAIYVAPVHRRLRERGTAALVVLMMALSFIGLSGGQLLLLAPLLCLQQVSFGIMQPMGRTSLNHRVGSAERASMLSAQSVVARLAFGLILMFLSDSDWDYQPDQSLAPSYLVLAAIATGAGLIWWTLHPRMTRSEKMNGGPQPIRD
jgi:MFS family permease